MGIKSSKVYMMDWDKADGGVKHHFETLDRSMPFREHHTLHMSENKNSETKRNSSSGASPRDCSITDEDGRVLYTTSAVESTAFWFDVSRCDAPVIQVRGHPWGTTWHVYCHHHAAFTGQAPAGNAAPRGGGGAAHHPPPEDLYLKARVVLNFKRDGAQVQLCRGKGGSDEKNGSSNSITWSKPILIYDDVNYLQGKGQTHLVEGDDSGNETSEDSNSSKSSKSIFLTSFSQVTKPGELELDVAKGCDVILQIVLNVIANQVRANTNPYMVHATGVPACDYM